VLAEERELAALVGGGKLLQHQSAEEFREHPYRKKEPRFGDNPVLAIDRETAAGHDHVHVGMMAPTSTIP